VVDSVSLVLIVALTETEDIKQKEADGSCVEMPPMKALWSSQPRLLK
jgi:hypothetical protein